MSRPTWFACRPHRCRASTHSLPRQPLPPTKAIMVCDKPVGAVSDAEVILTMLPHGDAVKRCYAEILPAASSGALFIDSSTISVDDAREVHASAASYGIAQLDAPVSGGVKGAVAGTLAFMVGGDDSALQEARPVLEPMAGKIIHCGGAGAGQAAKVCNNMVLAVQQIAVGEAFVLAEEAGLYRRSRCSTTSSPARRETAGQCTPTARCPARCRRRRPTTTSPRASRPR